MVEQVGHDGARRAGQVQAAGVVGIRLLPVLVVLLAGGFANRGGGGRGNDAVACRPGGIPLRMQIHEGTSSSTAGSTLSINWHPVRLMAKLLCSGGALILLSQQLYDSKALAQPLLTSADYLLHVCIDRWQFRF